jgi:hypothetical protein
MGRITHGMSRTGAGECAITHTAGGSIAESRRSPRRTGPAPISNAKAGASVSVRRTPSVRHGVTHGDNEIGSGLRPGGRGLRKKDGHSHAHQETARSGCLAKTRKK